MMDFMWLNSFRGFVVFVVELCCRFCCCHVIVIVVGCRVCCFNDFLR